MVMVFHDCVCADLNGKYGGKLPQSIDQPYFAVAVVPVRDRVESTQECAADTTTEAMVHSFLSLLDVFAARQSHASPSLISLMVKSTKVPRKNHKYTDKWVSSGFFQWFLPVVSSGFFQGFPGLSQGFFMGSHDSPRWIGGRVYNAPHRK
jgi:hypothetical protein